VAFSFLSEEAITPKRKARNFVSLFCFALLFNLSARHPSAERADSPSAPGERATRGRRKRRRTWLRGGARGVVAGRRTKERRAGVEGL